MSVGLLVWDERTFCDNRFLLEGIPTDPFQEWFSRRFSATVTILRGDPVRRPRPVELPRSRNLISGRNQPSLLFLWGFGEEGWGAPLTRTVIAGR